MALTKFQEQAVIDLFVMAFKSSKTQDECKTVFLQFESDFGKSIPDWKVKCRLALIEQSADSKELKTYHELTNGNNWTSALSSVCVVRALKKDDLSQIREIINQSLNLQMLDNKDLEKFVETRYSFVACIDDEIVGVILADDVCKLFFSEIWIDVFAVAEYVRGQGIGKKLLNHLKQTAVDEKKNVLNTHTERDRTAYQIYKHWGFKEIEGVQMEKFCI